MEEEFIACILSGLISLPYLAFEIRSQKYINKNPYLLQLPALNRFVWLDPAASVRMRLQVAGTVVHKIKSYS